MRIFRSPGSTALSAGSVAPLQQTERITIIDSLRGIALLGILLMNIPFFAMPFQAAENLNIRNEYSGLNYYSWLVVNVGFEGTMRGLFSLLFGAGTILLLHRLEKKSAERNPADIYYRRLIWLLIFGLINAFIFLWPGDILYAYAICGLFLFPFRNMKAKHLFMFSMLFLLIFTLKGTTVWYDMKQTKVKGEHALSLEKKKIKLTEEQTEDKGKWAGFQEKMKIETLRKDAAKETAKMQQGYFGVMTHLKDINVKIESTGFYSFAFFDVMVFLFLGMALFKWGVLTGERSTRFYAILMVAGYTFGLALAYLHTRTLVQIRFDPTAIFDRLLINYYQVKRIFITLGHVGFVMLLYKYHIADMLLKWLSRVGQMAFSNYLMQSIICGFIFYGFGLKWFGYMERFQLYIVVFGVWIFQVVFSNVWLSYFKFGPFEWLWRSLTYWKKQPFKRKAETVEAAPIELVIPA